MCERDGESIDSGSPGLGLQSIPLGPRLTRGAFAVLPKPSVYIILCVQTRRGIARASVSLFIRRTQVTSKYSL